MHLKGTGGGPYKQSHFSPLEEEVIEMVNLQNAVSGSSGGKKFGKRPSHVADIESGEDVPTISAIEEMETNISDQELEDYVEPHNIQHEHNMSASISDLPRRRRHRAPQNSTQQASKESLLNMQVDIQKKTCDALEKATTDATLKDVLIELQQMRRIMDISNNLLEESNLIKQKKLDEQKKQNLQNNRFKYEELNLLKRKLEIEELKLKTVN